VKTLLIIAIACIPLAAFGAEPRQPNLYLNPADFSTKRQDCNLIVGVVSYIPTWRDNKVPVARAHKNIEDLLIKVAAADEDKLQWHQVVDRLYGSKVTTKEVEGQLRPMCEKIP
jgi:hypothetical protein